MFKYSNMPHMAGLRGAPNTVDLNHSQQKRGGKGGHPSIKITNPSHDTDMSKHRAPSRSPQNDKATTGRTGTHTHTHTHMFT